MNQKIKGVTESPLKRIQHPDGDIFHALKSTEESYAGFGEAYFTTVHKGAIKGWKMHNIMTLNLIVPQGTVSFYCHNKSTRENYQTTIGRDNYARLTISPGLWVAFEGIDDGVNLVLNIANIPHDPSESVTEPINTFPIHRVSS